MNLKRHPLQHADHASVVLAGRAWVLVGWWIMSQGNDAPLFRVLARKWRSVDKRERRMTPFQMALPGVEEPKHTRNSFGPQGAKRLSLMAELAKKTKRAGWNPWMLTK
jgi:hypothetical protein